MLVQTRGVIGQERRSYGGFRGRKESSHTAGRGGRSSHKRRRTAASLLSELASSAFIAEAYRVLVGIPNRPANRAPTEPPPVKAISVERGVRSNSVTGTGGPNLVDSFGDDMSATIGVVAEELAHIQTMDGIIPL